MAQINFKATIEEIVREYDNLLFGKGLENPDYDVIVDPNQAVGFGPNNKETAKAMHNLSREKYDGLLTKLSGTAEHYPGPCVLNRIFFYE